MKNKKTETIIKLYNHYIEDLPPLTEEYKKLSNEFIDKIESFRNELTKEKKEELDRIIDLLYSMNSELDKQTFIEAYTLGARLTIETLYRKK